MITLKNIPKAITVIMWMQFGEWGSAVVINVNEEVLAHKLVVQGESNQELFLGLEFGIEGIRFGVPWDWFEGLKNMNGTP